MQREEPGESHDNSRSKSAIDAIVIGAGPVGLAAGLASALAISREVTPGHNEPARIKILEQRFSVENRDKRDARSPWGSRLRNIVLDRRTVDFLENLGVRVPGQIIRQMRILHAGEHNYFPDNRAWERAYVAAYLRQPTHLTPTGDLERSLLRAINQINDRGRSNIEVVFGASDAKLTDTADGVSVQYSEGGVRRSETAKLGIIADGAKSRTLAALGIGRSGPKIPERIDYLAADFADDRLDYGFPTYRFDLDDQISWLSAAFTANGVTSLIIIAPPNSRPGEPVHVRREESALVAMARKMGIAGNMIGAIFRFTNEVDHADQVQIGHIYVMGEAARQTNPASGNGVNMGLIDVQGFRGLVHQMRDPASAGRANKQFVQAVARNTIESTEGSLWVDEWMAWLKHDRRNFRYAQSLWRYGLTPGSSVTNAVKDMFALIAQSNPIIHQRMVEYMLAAYRAHGLPLPAAPGQPIRMKSLPHQLASL